MSDYIVVVSTAGTVIEAEKIAEALVETKLAACVQHTPIASVYKWKGKTESASEHLLIIKTRAENFKAVEEMIKELHSYECPEVIALPINDGSKSYLSWIRESTELNP